VLEQDDRFCLCDKRSVIRPVFNEVPANPALCGVLLSLAQRLLLCKAKWLPLTSDQAFYVPYYGPWVVFPNCISSSMNDLTICLKRPYLD
jgi:hypothetical protein